MKTSLNINQFLGKSNWTKLHGQYNTKEQIWNDTKEHIFLYIKEHLLNENDIIFLHEVPYINEVSYFFQGKTKYKRAKKDTDKITNEDLCKIYTDLRNYCDVNSLKIFNPDSSEASYFQTLAIVRNNNSIFRQIETKQFFDQYASRIIALQSNNEIIIGVHIPENCNDYWDSLDKLHHSLSSNITKIYLGDFNTYKPGTTNKKRFYKFLSNDLVDLWLETGHLHTRETSDMHTRIDYALVSGEKYSEMKYEIFIDDIIRKQGYSDHSSIIVL